MLTRDRLFAEFSGNGDILEKCAALLSENRFPHAVVIEGDDGLGKSTLARLIAMALLCKCSEDTPDICEHCRKVKGNIHPDVYTVIGEGKSGNIPVDKIREIHADTVLAPHEADRKVYIIEDCEHLPVQSQNALLKMFEEPPAGVFFILTCRSGMSLLTTIRSRAQIFSLLPVTAQDAIERIALLRPTAGHDAVVSAAAQCGGNIGVAVSLIGDDGSCTESEWDAKARQAAVALCAEDEQSLLSVCTSLGINRDFCIKVIDSMREIIRRAVIVNVGAKNTLAVCGDDVMAPASSLSLERLYAVMSELDELKRALNAFTDTRMLFPAVMCARLRRAAGK